MHPADPGGVLVQMYTDCSKALGGGPEASVYCTTLLAAATFHSQDLQKNQQYYVR